MKIKLEDISEGLSAYYDDRRPMTRGQGLRVAALCGELLNTMVALHAYKSIPTDENEAEMTARLETFSRELDGLLQALSHD